MYVEAHTALEGRRAVVKTQPQRVTDTVIVKLRTTEPTQRRFAAAVAAIDAGREAPETLLLEALQKRGHVGRFTPIFGAADDADTPATRAVRGARIMAAAIEPRPTSRVKHALGLMAVEVTRGTDAADLARHLTELGSDIEYAYVPAIKHPLVPAGGRGRGGGHRGGGGATGRGGGKAGGGGGQRAGRAGRRRPAGDGDTLGARQWNHGVVQIAAARASSGFVDANNVKVAVVDTGVDLTHPDLHNVVVEYENFLKRSEADKDFIGHGTHVIGILAAVTGNNLGIAGLCKTQIYAAKGLPKPGAPFNAQQYLRAVGYALDVQAQVVNMSLGGGYDPGEEAVIQDLLDAGIIVVAAMGNEFLMGNATSYPAAYKDVIAVGATDETDRRADFSCTGEHIALCAPGVRILSTVPMYPSAFAQQVEYDAWPGTSMAAPHVAAAAALLLANNGDLKPQEVRRKLLKSADKVPGQKKFDNEHGAGRLNIAKALA
ncbi:MAG: hypothetical protein QOF78_3895 [Phycisphaerales bacterium]|jgi:subtilisin family serine protease|nr:hypothetical protein [Phycisphaerales bacterium]